MFLGILSGLALSRPDERHVLLHGGTAHLPQIFLDGRPVGGFDDIAALEAEGRLDLLLAAPGDAAD